ncbi:30S ribosomal protein S1 [Fuerstiella marisgermanici]|uniref:Small ribosomal subunit protein bS1 n=1 Tax=Fuerstiella marisgermanici TaxID=1891926 RepID=A0A1P8WFL1_9PLAN|nr:30S ribosomal protein S1 [Fuerstiella marisgermanici]APZ92836.1 30S ribosomal protein S1 [Fuerstiella marisgermanici]
MVDRHLLREFSVDDAELEAVLEGSFDALDEAIQNEAHTYDINDILQGTVVRVDDEEVVVDIGYKSEGVIQREEWEDGEKLPSAGEQIEVLLEEFEDSIGLIVLSMRKARRVRDWEEIIKTHAEGDVVSGPVVRKIKGGLLVLIGREMDGDDVVKNGVNVFLPASQVDVRRPPDIADYIGQDIECMILKIDEARKNIVVSRRRLIEEEREREKQELLKVLEVGTIRKGTVKNIADFGAFVDLGGIDGLLHITDMSWGRINHPTEVVKIDDDIEVMVLNIDYEKEKIALGLKQKSASPWENISEKYPVGSRITGEVVNVLSYGAFVKLEDGIEGLVHISEMSWTRRINHPSELVAIGDEVEVMVLGINEDKQEISLGMKQTQENPWDNVADKYPLGSKVKGTVRNLTNYGAFIELEEGVDGLLHISDMSWTRKISHSNEMLKKGEPLECEILSVDQERRRIALGLKQLDDDPWETTIPEKYSPGRSVTGKVTKITNFGVFVELEDELEGLLHVSELSEDKIEHPETMVKVGDELEVRILRVDTADRKIGLSCRSDEEIREAAAAEAAQGGGGDGGGSAPARKVEDLKGGTGDSSKPLFSLGGSADDSSDADDGDAKAEDATEEENSDEEKPSEEG